MDRQFVTSSMMVSIGYDASQGVLEIEFKSDGSIWQYYDFPESMWNDFQFCDSHGKYWHASIKNAFHESKVG